MAKMAADLHAHLEALPPAEWKRLVRHCSRISGSADAAEDLAQETLIEAWRRADSLPEPSAYRAWLFGVARNVCLRWRRLLAREIDRRERLASERRSSLPGAIVEPDVAIERDEMATLLDRALGVLPAGTRDALVLRYIGDLGNREIADRLGLSEGAVAVRLHRGRSALRAALSRPGLRDDAEALGLAIPTDGDGWTVTRIWCPFCGRHRLKTRIDAGTGMLYVTCTGACLDSGTIIGGTTIHPDTAGLTSIKSIVSRELVHLHDYYRSALAGGGNRCVACGRFLPIDAWHPDHPSPAPTAHPHGVHMRCGHCGDENSASLWHLLIDTPEAQRFWRRHPRMAALPVREVERDGRATLVSGFASADGARLEIVSARETFDILHIDAPADR